MKESYFCSEKGPSGCIVKTAFGAWGWAVGSGVMGDQVRAARTAGQVCPLGSEPALGDVLQVPPAHSGPPCVLGLASMELSASQVFPVTWQTVWATELLFFVENYCLFSI